MNNTEDLSIVRPELLQIAEAVARDKAIDQELVTNCCKEKIWTRTSN